MEYILIAALLATVVLLALNRRELLKVVNAKEDEVTARATTTAALEERLNQAHDEHRLLKDEVALLQASLKQETINNATILSQKKSSETKLGVISEHLVPLMAGLPYNPTNLHHLGQPIDFIYFDYEAAEIVLIEVKSGGARESTRQRLIKNAIRMGKVYYEQLRIDEKGIKVKRSENV